LESILYEKAPPRATITFNRPDVLNAFDRKMLRELAEACEEAANDDDVRVVVLTGAGRAFCVGANLRAWADEGLVANEREYWKWFRAMDEGVTAIRKIGKPTVARINGICVGGGNEMQMACDLAVMVEDAFIRHVGLQHGSVPAAGATQWLPILVGDRRAREIVMLCEEIPARKAEEWGLVNRAVPAAELDAAVDDVVSKLADRLPLMTRYAKVQLDFWRDQAWYGTIRHAHDWLALSMLSEDAQAGVRGFLERREKE
jgi:enoyl-CoA hydratase/carnithine racemase